MTIFQIYIADFDHSLDPGDILPSDILFLDEEKAKEYVEKNGGAYYPVETKD